MRPKTAPVDRPTVPACLYRGRKLPRAVRGHHVTPDGVRVCDDRCQGCEPCRAAHCTVCERAHLADEPGNPALTCPGCVNRVRGNLVKIEQLAKLLRPQAVNSANDGRLAAAAPIPGGAAMELIGPNADWDDWADNWRWAQRQAEHLRALADSEPAKGKIFRQRADDLEAHLSSELDSDKEPPLLTLSKHAHDWRVFRNEPTSLKVTLTRTHDYLVKNLDWAAQTIPAFDNFARDIAGCVRTIEAAIHGGEPDEKADVSCLECGDELTQTPMPPRTCPHRTEARQIANSLLDPGKHSQGFLDLLALRIQKELLAARPDYAAAHRKCEQGGMADLSMNPDLRNRATWACVKCGKTYTRDQYNLAVRGMFEDLAKDRA